MEKVKSIDLNDYTVLNKIGSGSFGQVFKVQNKKTKEIFAAKVTATPPAEQLKDFKKTMEREILHIFQIHHPSILRFIGVSKSDFSGDNNPVIITEYLSNGSLSDLLSSSLDDCHQDQWNDTIKLINIYGIATSMAFLHAHNIIHRDLKPANILLNDYLFPILADFGLSKNQSLVSSTIEIKGTPLYIPPETWEEETYSKEGDVYAFALIVYEIITNEKPFRNLSTFQVMKRVTKGERPDTSLIPKPYKDLIEACWSNEPSKRPTFDQIVEELGNNPLFITDQVEKEDYQSYIDYIKKSPKSFDTTVKIDGFDIFIKKKAKAIKKVSLKKRTLYPETKLKVLSNDCKIIVKRAEDDPDKQYELGRYLINGENNFPKDINLGIKYLQSAINAGNIDAAIFYNEMLIAGKKIDCDLEKAKSNLKKYDSLKNNKIIFLQAMIEKKQGNFAKALKLLKISIKAKNGEAMFEYGKFFFYGNGVKRDEKKANYFFKQAKENGCNRCIKFLDNVDRKTYQKPIYQKNVDIVFLIDGTSSNTFFYEAIRDIFDQIANRITSIYTNIYFRFGVVIYRDLIVSQKSPNCIKRYPFILDLTDSVEDIEKFFYNHKPKGLGINRDNDWACGYHALNTEISWNKKAKKIVIQACHLPAHGKYFTMKPCWKSKYIKLPTFSKDFEHNQNVEIYRDIQQKQTGWLSHNIYLLAKKGVNFFCLNGNEISLYCFRKVLSKFLKIRKKKFVIKDLFGFTSVQQDDTVDMKVLMKEIEQFVLNSIDASLNDEETSFEIECKQQFGNDLNNFYKENKGFYKPDEFTDTDNEDDFLLDQAEMDNDQKDDNDSECGDKEEEEDEKEEEEEEIDFNKAKYSFKKHTGLSSVQSSPKLKSDGNRKKKKHDDNDD
ncbi:hypothetical protein M9Y10_023596 [Tritrichomonas musculus]|uniref:Protein kinase domain-containing protein n=1 Tax=Tritrichomonas musculus TaxID=1915356 RepID=A0ABR2KVM8_9EUKA